MAFQRLYSPVLQLLNLTNGSSFSIIGPSILRSNYHLRLKSLSPAFFSTLFLKNLAFLFSLHSSSAYRVTFQKENLMETVKHAAKVQHLTKASSEELLRKFAEVGSEKEDRISAKKELQLAKRLKRSDFTRKAKADCYGVGRMYVDQCVNLNGTNASIVEKKSLLGPVIPSQRFTATGRTRTIGIGKSKNRAREIKNKSLMNAIEKTWRRTIDGASKIFMDKHYYNRHKRLANDLY